MSSSKNHLVARYGRIYQNVDELVHVYESSNFRKKELWKCCKVSEEFTEKKHHKMNMLKKPPENTIRESSSQSRKS